MKNIQIFDKKEFIIEVNITMAQVVTLEDMRSRKIIGASQDKNKKQV